MKPRGPEEMTDQELLEELKKWRARESEAYDAFVLAPASKAEKFLKDSLIAAEAQSDIRHEMARRRRREHERAEE